MVTNSGSDVPTATIVKPMIIEGILNVLAITEAESKKTVPKSHKQKRSQTK